MKLISEEIQDAEYLIEDANGKKNYKIKGIFLQSDIKNRNGRVYPKEIMIKEVNRYNKEFVEKKRAFGELGHPDGPTVNLERVSHMITNLQQDGSNYVGEAKIMNTPYGKIVKGLIDEGAQLGVSSRGMGSLEQGCTINEKETKDKQIKILYPVSKQIETTLQYYFKNISFTHYTQILYDLSSSGSNADDSIEMKVHMQDNQFDLLVFKSRELLLFNTFPYKNEDGFLYFVFAVAEELSLSPETFNMVFFGKYARYKKCYEALEKYHKKIVFSDQTGFLMFDEGEHPAPYFINIFD